MKLVNPANRRKHTVIIVGSGLAGASAAASLGQQGYHVHCFSFHDSPRRAHSIAAQGGINAAKNYRNDGDSIQRLFYDTVKGGDFRSREANVYRLAQISVNIIDQCVAQGVPFAREYGGLLDTRSFGGVQVSRTFYARGQTGQQLLLGAYQALEEQIAAGTVKMHTRSEMLDLVVVNGRARGIVTRNLVTGAIETFAADVRGAGDRRLRQRLLSFDQRQGLQHHGDLARASPRRVFRQSLLHADSPDVHSGEQRKSIQADADVGIAAERRARVGSQEKGRHAAARRRFPRTSAIITSSGAIRVSEIWFRATWPPAPPRKSATKGAASAPAGRACIWISPTRFDAWAEPVVREKYGNLFDMYEEITGENAYKVPMRIYPAVALHDGRAVGGLPADVHDSRAFRCRGSEFLRPRREPPGRQRADARPGGRIFHSSRTRLPNYIASNSLEKVDTSHPAFARRQGRRQPAHREAARHSGQANRGFHPQRARQADVGKLRDGALGGGPAEQPRKNSRRCARNSGTTCDIIGTGEELNQSLEKAGRVADFLELGELMCLDALRARGILRRALPRREPDAGRRSDARRREISRSSRHGNGRAKATSGNFIRSRSRSSTFTLPRGATSSP